MMTSAHNAKLGLLIMAAALLASSSLASADVLTLRGDARLGVAGGKGMFGERKDDSFHEGRGTLGYGLVLGAEVFFVDLWVEHNQFLGGGKVSGTWTQFMLGFDVDIDISEKQPASEGAYSLWFAELGMGAGFGVGTGQQVNPPLDNGQVTDKGAVFEARGQVGYRLTSLLSVGLTVPFQFGYFIKSGDGAVANNVDNHYSAMGGQAMLTFRANWNVK